MSIQHHISDEILFDYANGSLTEGWSLVVATHLALCPVCRAVVGDAEAVGGALLETEAVAAVADDAFDKVMGMIGAPTTEAPVRPARTATPRTLPSPLYDYLGGDIESLAWKSLGRGAYHIPIPTMGGARARLLRIPAGAPVPEHGHNGLELTLVLCGSFSDKTGAFGRGDVQEADAELEHQPIAAAGEDCICLAVTDAPLRFKSWAARLVQPMLGI